MYIILAGMIEIIKLHLSISKNDILLSIRDDEFPLNIIELNYANVDLISEQVFRVTCLDRNYEFKTASSFDRDISNTYLYAREK